MAIISNVDLLNTYDRNALVTSTRVLGGDASDAQEHAAQCLAFEMLRELLASGLTVRQYNDMTDEAWEKLCMVAKTRAALNINAPVAKLTPNQCDAACNIGGNYFEHGYQFIMDGISQENKMTLTRVGGV